MKRNLERQSRLSYARFSSYQHERAFDQTSTEDPVDLPVVERYPVLHRRIDVRQRHGLMTRTRHRHSRCRRTLLSRRHSLLNHSIPLPARRASSHPLRTLVSACLAEPHRLCLYRRHNQNLDKSISFIPSMFSNVTALTSIFASRTSSITRSSLL